jgi:putative hydrolase of the HAD superfamily
LSRAPGDARAVFGERVLGTGKRAVLFDAGGTLIEADPPVGEVYANAARRHGIEVSPADAAESFSLVWRRLRDGASDNLVYGTTDRQARQWWRRVVVESFRPFGEPDDPGALFEDLYLHFARPDAWRVYPEVNPALDELRACGLGLGIVSNWDTRLRKVLEDLGLARKVDAVMISSEIGCEKPDPRIFAAALKALGARPDEAVHVGDMPAEDVVGALEAGLGAILVDRTNGAADADIPEDVPRVTGIDEVVRILGR